MLDRDFEEVAAHELDTLIEARQALAGELDHRLGEVHPQIRARAGLEHQLPHAARAAADVQDARRRIGADRFDRQLAPAEQAGTQQADQRALVLVEVVELAGLRPEPVTDALRCLR